MTYQQRRITNDGGEWIGPSTFARLSPIEYSTVTSRLEGQRGYEGLTAIIEFQWQSDCGYDLQGFIVDNDLPDDPTPVAE